LGILREGAAGFKGPAGQLRHFELRRAIFALPSWNSSKRQLT
jgi:hypothetical protein